MNCKRFSFKTDNTRTYSKRAEDSFQSTFINFFNRCEFGNLSKLLFFKVLLWPLQVTCLEQAKKQQCAKIAQQ